MDLVFITNDDKLSDLKIDPLVIEAKMEKFEGESFFCFFKILGEHKIYVLYDGQGEPLCSSDEEIIIPTIKEVLKRNNYFIVQHSNQSKEITALTDLADKNKVFTGMHDLKSPDAIHYKNLPNYLTNKGDALNKLVEDITNANEEINTLNQKLTFLHKLLGNNFDKELAKKFEIKESEFNENDINNSVTTLANQLIN